MNHLELRIPPIAVAFIFATMMVAVDYAVPDLIVIPARLIIAAFLGLGGTFVALLGVITFHKHKTTVNPLSPDRSSSLVTSGIYRFSRNPMYLGFFFALLGLCVYLQGWLSALLLPAFASYMSRFQIQPEERALAKLFGSRFTEYSTSVRRWL